MEKRALFFDIFFGWVLLGGLGFYEEEEEEDEDEDEEEERILHMVIIIIEEY